MSLIPRLPSWSDLSSRLPTIPNPVSLIRTPELVSAKGRHHRRMWVGDRQAHIEVRGLRGDDAESIGLHVVEAIEAMEGVDWAAVNAVIGRVVIEFGGEVDPSALVEAIEVVEAAHDLAVERFSHDRPEHPGDGDHQRRTTLALAADVAGMGVSMIGSALRATPIPVELGSLAGLIDSQPRLRAEIENRVGPLIADAGLALGGAVGQALSQGPLGLAVDAVHNANLLVAGRARDDLWRKRHLDLTGEAEIAKADPSPPGDRPQDVPKGPVELYADRSGIASLAGGAAVLTATRSLRRAGAMVVAGMAKPARLGRESFVASLERSLASRDVVVLDRRALELLDRVSCLVVTEDVLVTGRVQLDRAAIAPGEDRAEVHRHLRRLFDPDRPERVRRSKGWSIGPLTALDRSGRIAEWMGDPEPAELGLSRDGHLVAVVGAAPEVDVAARLLVDQAHESGLAVVVAGGDSRLLRRVRGDLQLSGGDLLAGSIRSLQADGQVVALVAHDGAAALQSADLGIGVIRSGVSPWGAHLICDRIEHARFIMEAAGVAVEASRQSDAINLTGSAVGSMAALTAPERVAAVRASNSVNLAALASMANGTRAAWALGRRPEPDVAIRARWHEMARSEVLRTLETSLGGLSADEANERAPRIERPEPPPVALARAILAELANPLTPVLAGGALVSAAVGSAGDAGIVFSVMALNGAIAGVQRFAADRAVRQLVSRGNVHAHARRDGGQARIAAQELVRGDIVALEAGDTVPADCRLLQTNALEIDESSLTGESQPIAKRTAASFGSLVSDRTCMAYAGTTVVAGSGIAVVVATDSDTEAAARDIGSGKGAPSLGGVEARLTQLGSTSLPVAGAGGLLMAAGQLLRGGSMQEALAGGVSLAVAAVPEGLPMLATVGQLAAARRLSRHGVLVRNPRAIEALGRTEVLCIDKTGTLTKGRIELRLVSDGVASAGAAKLAARHRAVLGAALRASPDDDGERSLPHFTDRAVVEAAASAGVDTSVGRHPWERGRELAFGPTRPFHAAWGTSAGRTVLSVKGAPEVVITRCRSWRRPTGANGRTAGVRLSGAHLEALERHVDELARRGLRLLAVAERRLPAGLGVPDSVDDDDVHELTLLGFLALADPIRSTAPEAVRGLRAAGVEIVMVTGDHKSTAAGIAAELGILNGNGVLGGAELEAMTDDELRDALRSVSVFARVAPAQKVRIVRAYQRAGKAVAMTGDGANDASAIRLADAGIALGRHCAPAARTAADVIITDDRIETIVEAIIEGRSLWASVRDALAILLGGNLGEIGFILAAGGLAGRPPLNPRQILLVNLLTDVAPSLAIVARPPADRSAADLAREGPDRSLGWQLNRAILERATVTTLGATGAWGVARVTGRARRASTVGLVALVGTQLGQTLTIGRNDPAIAAAALVSAGILTGIVQTPGVSHLFGCTPLGPVAWATVVGNSTGAVLLGRFVPGLIDAAVDRIPSLGAGLADPAAPASSG